MKTVSLSVSDDESGEDEVKEKDIADYDGEPSEQIIREEKIKKIREIINSLPDDLREVIVLRDLQNLSYTQIADMLDVEIGTVKSRLNRAREKLKNNIIKNNKNGELF